MHKKIKSYRSSVLFTLVLLLCGPLVQAQMNGMEMASTTTPERPLTVKSNEATKKQLASARAEGDAVSQCTSWLLSKATPVAGQLKAGEYQLTYALSAPEGWYEFNNNSLIWIEPGHANAHLWLFVQDGGDGRIVPPLNIRVTVKDNNGALVSQFPIRYAWMPLVNGYGENMLFPGPGTYQLQFEIDPPLYHRHDPYNGDRFMKQTTAISRVDIPQNWHPPIISEAMEGQQDLSVKAGQAYSNTLKVMYKQANDGKDTVVGDYFLACAVEYSEGYWYNKDGKIVYKMDNELSAENNAHVEVVARDARTGRFLHNLNVVATVYDSNEKLIGTKREMFMWHPWLYHYGENWRVPKAGNYNIRVHIDPPPYRRYGKTLGQQLTNPVEAEFKNVNIKTGQK